MKTECENHAGMDGYARLKADCAVCREMALEREEKPAEKGLFTTGYYDALKAAMRPLKGSSDAPENHIIDDWLESLGPVQHWDPARGCTALTQNDPGKRPHGYQPPAIEKSEPHPAAPLPGETEEHRRIRTFDSPYPATSQDTPIPYTVRGVDYAYGISTSVTMVHDPKTGISTVTDIETSEDTPIPYTAAKAWCPTCGEALHVGVTTHMADFDDFRPDAPKPRRTWFCNETTCSHDRPDFADHEVWRRWEDTDKVEGFYWLRNAGTGALCCIPTDGGDHGGIEHWELVIGPIPQPKAPK